MTVKAQSSSLRPAGRSDSHEQIFDAARTLFAERGSEGVTMAEVAEAAGVARATVFNQFGSKHGLVEAITEDVFSGYVELLDNALAATKTPVPGLVLGLFDVMGQGIESDREFYSAAFREISRVTLGLEEGGVAERARLAAVERLVHLLTRGQARGELAGDLDPEDLATAFDSLVFGTITHWLYADATASLPERMLRAAHIFLGPVSLAPATASNDSLALLSVETVRRPGRHGSPQPRKAGRR